MKQPPPTDLAALAQRLAAGAGEARAGAAGRRAAWAAGLLGFACFLPYPAISYGSNSAIQAGNVVAFLMALPVLALPWRGRPFWVYPLLLAPLCVSAVKVGLTGGDLALCLKTIVVWVVTCQAIVAAQLWAPGYAIEMMTGIAAATLLHVAVGLWQWISFARGEFPLAELYVNPSFLSVQDHVQSIARYTQRPFGLFPEPSAMTSSLGPWVLFWTAELCGLVRLRREPGPRTRALFATATAGALVLMVISQSGHTAVVLAAALAFAAVWFVRARATLRTYATVVTALCVVLPAGLWFAAESLAGRVGNGLPTGNSSWEDRSDSLVLGLSIFARGDLPTVLFGNGAGLTNPMLWAAARLEAVWSVLLGYVYDTGLAGGLVACGVGQYLLRIWKSMRFDLVFAAFAIVWLVGITVTTSYEQLLPQWLALGWLTVWRSVCVAPGDATVPSSEEFFATRR